MERAIVVGSVMSNVVVDLLKRAISVGASEVRLIPGRRTVVVLPHGESEVRGDAHTPDRINAMVQPVLTSEARRDIASGFAEWEFDVDGRGPARARAEQRNGQLHVMFYLDNLAEGARRAPPAAPVPSAPQMAAPAAFDRNLPPVPADSMPPALGVPARFAAPAIGTVPSQAEPKLPNLGGLEVDVGRVAPIPTQPSLSAVRPSQQPGMGTIEIDRLLRKLVELKGSDLHISTGAPPMIRKDGEMQPLPGGDALSADDVKRMLMPMVPPRNQEEFERTHDTDFAHEISGVARFRANLFVDLKGTGGVFRIIPSKILTVEELGIPKEVLSLCHLPKGLVLVTGPTGSGKSTTLAALIDYINRVRSDHIITIEDPVEFVHPNKKCLINQRQVGEHTDSFKKALRAALREDPDIVLLGEMRDLETIAIALETAETGHLVFGTLHTSSAPATIDRIIDQYPPEQQAQIRVMLANSLKGVLAQMLCKKIGGGRAAAWEIMFGVPAISNLIREQKIFQIPSIIQTGRKLGMALMNDSLFRLVKEGLVAPEEALSKANDKPGLVMMYQQAQIPVPKTVE